MASNPKIGWFHLYNNPNLTKKEQIVAYLLESTGILTIILLTWLKFRPVTEMSATAAIILLTLFVLFSLLYFIFYVRSVLKKKTEKE